MKRLKDISEQIRAGITQFVEDADNAESLLEKTIVDMKKRLAEAKELVATAIAEEQRLKRTHQEAVNAAEVWRKKGDAALQERDIVRANEARQHTQQQLHRANDYKQQIVAQKAVVARLKATLQEFYQQFQNAVKRAEGLHQRQKQAETRTEFYKLLRDEIDTEMSNAFEQAEQKLKATETEAEFWEERKRHTDTQPETTGADGTIDRALAALKKDILDSK